MGERGEGEKVPVFRETVLNIPHAVVPAEGGPGSVRKIERMRCDTPFEARLTLAPQGEG